ncbi:hypothetical protein AVEN_48811-1 [Araneus ventricosus]|uniref:Uncharacterized protein n=1 Tax=Araneus ventricosus TaxID=182803 RepID=A0A4Y2TXN1_ARAVE|nr:hypothetical protein AVEN_204039-1 [Araneus ventricosus]GBO05455.1 hypothetical protein AVEN_48811-1 [Araneus ventricosus]
MLTRKLFKTIREERIGLVQSAQSFVFHYSKRLIYQCGTFINYFLFFRLRTSIFANTEKFKASNKEDSEGRTVREHLVRSLGGSSAPDERFVAIQILSVFQRTQRDSQFPLTRVRVYFAFSREPPMNLETKVCSKDPSPIGD